ncbi:YLP motif-containing protein 1-like [Hyperolius riggenbachi]|uniref:YLP motif-containing protein 1-like n=1 Tax=Hyperolius riggenbachi TaxID=752182 RepID=UPI0035A38AEF
MPHVQRYFTHPERYFSEEDYEPKLKKTKHDRLASSKKKAAGVSKKPEAKKCGSSTLSQDRRRESDKGRPAKPVVTIDLCNDSDDDSTPRSSKNRTPETSRDNRVAYKKRSESELPKTDKSKSNDSKGEFSQTSTAFIGPLFQPPAKTDSLPKAKNDTKIKPQASRINTVEPGNSAIKSNSGLGIDNELEQFYKELCELGDTNDDNERECDNQQDFSPDPSGEITSQPITLDTSQVLAADSIFNKPPSFTQPSSSSISAAEGPVLPLYNNDAIEMPLSFDDHFRRTFPPPDFPPLSSGLPCGPSSQSANSSLICPSKNNKLTCPEDDEYNDINDSFPRAITPPWYCSLPPSRYKPFTEPPAQSFQQESPSRPKYFGEKTSHFGNVPYEPYLNRFSDNVPFTDPLAPSQQHSSHVLPDGRISLPIKDYSKPFPAPPAEPSPQEYQGESSHFVKSQFPEAGNASHEQYPYTNYLARPPWHSSHVPQNKINPPGLSSKTSFPGPPAELTPQEYQQKGPCGQGQFGEKTMPQVGNVSHEQYPHRNNNPCTDSLAPPPWHSSGVPPNGRISPSRQFSGPPIEPSTQEYQQEEPYRQSPFGDKTFIPPNEYSHRFRNNNLCTDSVASPPWHHSCPPPEDSSIPPGGGYIKPFPGPTAELSPQEYRQEGPYGHFDKKTVTETGNVPHEQYPHSFSDNVPCTDSLTPPPWHSLRVPPEGRFSPPNKSFINPRSGLPSESPQQNCHQEQPSGQKSLRENTLSQTSNVPHELQRFKDNGPFTDSLIPPPWHSSNLPPEGRVSPSGKSYAKSFSGLSAESSNQECQQEAPSGQKCFGEKSFPTAGNVPQEPYIHRINENGPDSLIPPPWHSSHIPSDSRYSPPDPDIKALPGDPAETYQQRERPFSEKNLPRTNEKSTHLFRNNDPSADSLTLPPWHRSHMPPKSSFSPQDENVRTFSRPGVEPFPQEYHQEGPYGQKRWEEKLLPQAGDCSNERYPHRFLDKSSSTKPKGRLVLLRGVPGSGKSTLARTLIDQFPDGIILSTDDYFSQENGWSYDASLLGDAHNWNRDRAQRAMDEERSPIIIDNTNTQGWEMKPYVEMALDSCYEVEFLEPDTWWKLDPRELEKRNTHKVSEKKISQMLKRYEYGMTVGTVMNSVEPRHVSSRPSRPPPEARSGWGASVDCPQPSSSFHSR